MTCPCALPCSFCNRRARMPPIRADSTECVEPNHLGAARIAPREVDCFPGFSIIIRGSKTPAENSRQNLRDRMLRGRCGEIPRRNQWGKSPTSRIVRSYHAANTGVKSQRATTVIYSFGPAEPIRSSREHVPGAGRAPSGRGTRICGVLRHAVSTFGFVT